ncbi:hypothetical protein PVT71_25285 (plasmid) [Salipiger sp. H15]|uniref:Uncharacterized protein n=1 Tax=Alloyangia sp. H15 TaxID=3029062 RepID=A0AAU8ARH1_9RHOB
MVELEAFHTHLYPGARGRLISAPPEGGESAARVHFSDGGVAGARLTGETLAVAGHRTAAGTGIDARSWRLRFSGSDFSVVSRIA